MRAKLRLCWCGTPNRSASGTCSPEHAERAARGVTAYPVGTAYIVEGAGMKFGNRFPTVGGGTRRGGMGGSRGT